MRTQLYRLTKYRVSNVGNPAIVVNSEEIIIMTRKNLSWSTPTRSFPRKLSVFLFKLRVYFFAYLEKKRKHFKGIQIFQEARKALFLFACYSTCWCFHYIKSGLKVFFTFLICTSALFSFFQSMGKDYVLSYLNWKADCVRDQSEKPTGGERQNRWIIQGYVNEFDFVSLIMHKITKSARNRLIWKSDVHYL